MSDVHVLEERRDLLRGRLDAGYQKLEAAEPAGADIAEWEAFWVGLLREYEAVCRQLDNLDAMSDRTPDAISRSATSTDTPCKRGDPMGVIQHADQLILGGTR